jgi:hypothetical protein
VLCLAGKHESWEGLQPAAASELSALLAKISAIASSVGMSGEDSRGGGAQGSHGRRRLPLGHIRAILSRAQANTWVSMHGVGMVLWRLLACWPRSAYDSCTVQVVQMGGERAAVPTVVLLQFCADRHMHANNQADLALPTARRVGSLTEACMFVRRAVCRRCGHCMAWHLQF